jgi:uncharacterized membrane protein YbaN (DUF454 family)
LCGKKGEKSPLAKNAPGLLKKILINIGGMALILLGIIGLFLPVLQGVLLIIAGFGLLSIGNERVRRWIDAVGKKYPKQAFVFKKCKAKILPQKKPLRNAGKVRLEKRAKN